ncbi:MAG: sigma-70 family RNA polymerase sigma factor [Verrucomicrobia bacterium]|nr:sigma-70 family RNA polymerase sigma factor [Kiritimatiellia bacterium]MCP5487979.1 sigma-70 family RNA polymerase sigma factor [Verrucomicrobiota bacterium]
MNKASPEPSNSEDGYVDWTELETWVEQARSGDEEAFGRVVQALHGRVYAVAYRYMGNADDAREVTQMTWVKAWQKLGTYRQQARFYTWIYRIAANAAMDHLRKAGRRRESEYLDALDHSNPPEVAASLRANQDRPDQLLMRKERLEAFESALGKLKEEHRMILVLRELEGMSYQEIAEVMKCRAGTVMSRLFYARKAIQKELKELL